MHDRESIRSFQTQVKVVGNENKLYSEELEAHFNLKVEVPANKVLQKIREFTQIEESERHALAKYILVMWKRVPKARERTLARIPNVLFEVGEEIHSELDHVAKVMPYFKEKVSHIKTRVTAYLDTNKANPSSSLWYENIDSETDHYPINALLSMNWVFLYHDVFQFLTSDNPVFFFEFEGIGSSESELTFPISSTITLWATRTTNTNGTFVRASNAAVKEINRRTASNSMRWVYSKRNESWILPFATKGEWSLTRLR